MDSQIDRITVWMESRFPDFDVRTGQTAEHAEWILDPGDGVPASRLRVPMTHLNRVDLPGDPVLELLEREDFADMVESEDGICRIVTTGEVSDAEMALQEC